MTRAEELAAIDAAITAGKLRRIQLVPSEHMETTLRSLRAERMMAQRDPGKLRRGRGRPKKEVGP